MKKVTQIDYQIVLLERMGPNMSAIEKIKLDNLKEQKAFMAEKGIEMKGTVVPRFPPGTDGIRKGRFQHVADSLEDVTRDKNKDVEEAENENADVDNTSTQVKKSIKSRGQGVSSPYLLFVQNERLKLNSKDPKAKLNKEYLQQTWKDMNVREKMVFNDLFRKKKEDIGEKFRQDIKSKALSEIDKKARRKIADKEYRERRSKDLEVKKQEEDSLKEKLKEIIMVKTEKAEQMSKYVENLKYEMQKIQKLKRDLIEKVVEKDVELIVLKEQFKALHKIHKSCVKAV